MSRLQQQRDRQSLQQATDSLSDELSGLARVDALATHGIAHVSELFSFLRLRQSQMGVAAAVATEATEEVRAVVSRPDSAVAHAPLACVADASATTTTGVVPSTPPLRALCPPQFATCT